MTSKKDDKESKISEVIKKVVSVGVGAAFMTEDAVKNILNDLPISKDVLSGLVSNAKTAKEDFVLSIREEVRSYLENVDPSHIVDNVVEKYDLEITTKVKFKKKNSKKNGSDKTI